MSENKTAAEAHPKPEGDDIILPDGTVVGSWNGDEVAQITLESGDDTTNKDDGQINFWTQNAS